MQLGHGSQELHRRGRYSQLMKALDRAGGMGPAPRRAIVTLMAEDGRKKCKRPFRSGRVFPGGPCRSVPKSEVTAVILSQKNDLQGTGSWTQTAKVNQDPLSEY